MDRFTKGGQCDRRPSWGRRNAGFRGAILAEMPQQLRQHHLRGLTPTNGTPSQDGCNGGVHTMDPKCHRRQNACVWDDFVSFIRLEVMRMEREKLPVTEKFSVAPPAPCLDRYQWHDNHSSIVAPSSSIDRSRPKHSTQLLNDDDDVPTQDPGSGRERLTRTFEKFARRLSPPSISRMPFARRLSPPSISRLPFSLDCSSKECGNVSVGYSRSSSCDTYFSDDDDDDESSSLEYSDDDSEVERAILASVSALRSVALSREDDDHHIQCAICLDCADSSNAATVSGCEHRFCFKCIDRWAARKNECPLCKKSFDWAVSHRRVRWY